MARLSGGSAEAVAPQPTDVEAVLTQIASAGVRERTKWTDRSSGITTATAMDRHRGHRIPQKPAKPRPHSNGRRRGPGGTLRRRNAQAFAISGGITLCGVIACVFTGVSHLRQYGHFAYDLRAVFVVLMFGAIAFFTGRIWWRSRRRTSRPPTMLRSGPR